MRVIDLVPHYDPRIAADGDPTRYEGQLPELFLHYRKYFCSEGDRYRALDRAGLETCSREIQERLPALTRTFEELSLRLDDVSLILFVGRSTGNGHALRLAGGFAAWLAVERFPTPGSIDTFLSHELAHAVHYSQVPELYFERIEEQRATGRQLITEGIATRIAMRAGGLDEGLALWGDFLAPTARDAWLARCRERHADLASRILEHWDEPIPGNPLFTGSADADVYQNRGGYYVGLRATIALEERGLSIGEIAHIPGSDIHKTFRSILREQALRL